MCNYKFATNVKLSLLLDAIITPCTSLTTPQAVGDTWTSVPCAKRSAPEKSKEATMPIICMVHQCNAQI